MAVLAWLASATSIFMRRFNASEKGIINGYNALREVVVLARLTYTSLNQHAEA